MSAKPPEDLVKSIAQRAAAGGLRIVTSESLTSGSIATRLGAGPNAADWFGGGVIAYQEGVKFDLLGVDEGPVVTPTCAEQMARGALRLFGADLAVSATGVGGPEPAEGKPPGTVFMCVATSSSVTTRELHLDGEPAEVLDQTCDLAIAMLAEAVGR
ncbi:MAG: CinA domain protein [Marmoricola sp.]|nr:CinA domain protein [Marmoricola sp.]